MGTVGGRGEIGHFKEKVLSLHSWLQKRNKTVQGEIMNEGFILLVVDEDLSTVSLGHKGESYLTLGEIM